MTAIPHRICQHCERLAYPMPRKLCWTCSRTPAIKALYPPRPGCGKSRSDYYDEWTTCPTCGCPWRKSKSNLQVQCSTCSRPEHERAIVHALIQKYIARAELGQPLFKDVA